MVKFMIEMWTNLVNGDVWRMWPEAGYNPIYGITSAAGYLDNSPILTFLKKNLQLFDGIQKRVIVSATDILDAGYRSYRLHEFNQSNHEMIASTVMGSAAMPFIFPPMNLTKFGVDDFLMDGGTTWNNNLVTGVDECLTMPGIKSTSQIEVDIVSLSPAELGDFQVSKYIPLTL